MWSLAWRVDLLAGLWNGVFTGLAVSLVFLDSTKVSYESVFKMFNSLCVGFL